MHVEGTTRDHPKSKADNPTRRDFLVLVVRMQFAYHMTGFNQK